MDFFLFSFSVGTFGVVFLILFGIIAVKRPEIKSARYMALSFFFGIASMALYELWAPLSALRLELTIEVALWLGNIYMAKAFGERAGWHPRAWMLFGLIGGGLVLLSNAAGMYDLIIMDIVAAAIMSLPIAAMRKNIETVIDRGFLAFIIAMMLIPIIRALVLMADVVPSGFADAREFHLALTVLSSSLMGMIGANAIAISIAHNMIQTHASAALTDPLTGLLNRRGMAQVVDEIEQDNTGNSLDERALVIFDIDLFKNVNDTYGHDAGDEVLMRIANTISELMKYHGHSARTGGEEFTLLFNSESTPAAFLVAEHLRVAIGMLRHKDLPDGKRVTVSMGLAFVRKGEPIKRTLRRADAALYQAKDAGRNRLRLADGDSLPEANEAIEMPHRAGKKDGIELIDIEL